MITYEVSEIDDTFYAAWIGNRSFAKEIALERNWILIDVGPSPFVKGMMRARFKANA